MSDVTRVLSQIEEGDPKAAEELLPLIYEELRNLAAKRMAQEPSGQTLQATALVHEAYVRLVDVDRVRHFNSRGHFFAAAAEAMRRILVERARRKRRIKHGGKHRAVDLAEAAVVGDDRPDLILAVDEALDALANKDPRAADLVKLRYFAGMTLPETAAVLGVSTRTADRTWAYAKAWLYEKLRS